jgi:hypothetical protein
MSTLLDSEEVDEFYSTTYGGFDEEAEDKEYITTTSEPKRQRLVKNLVQVHLGIPGNL